MDQEFYTTRQVADLLGVDTSTVTIWVKRGWLPGAYKVGLGRNSHLRIPKQSVEDFIAKREASGKLKPVSPVGVFDLAA